MSRAALLLVLPVMLACTKKDAAMADSAATVPDTTAAVAAPVNYAGNWTVTVMPADKDTVLVTYDLVSTNDMTGWKMKFADRPEMSPKILAMNNDSVVIHNGPYASVLRKNTQVTTHSVMHMDGDKMVGNTVATYATKAGDSLVNLRTSAMRK
ncbi:MAG: hypothetical protein ABI556_15345 [Gemmatimonadales bacterium]